MATNLRAHAPFLPLGVASVVNTRALVSISSYKQQRLARPLQLNLSRLPTAKSPHFPTFFGASGETAETEEVEEEATSMEDSDDEAAAESGVSGGDIADMEDSTASVEMALLHSCKEALANGDQSRVAEIEAFLLSLEDEKNTLESKVALLSAELTAEKDRVLRISADFDNFRKRTERERRSLMTNVQGEVVESLLPVIDNFERAKAQIKVETEGEEKIISSYQSINKQFQEILDSLGVEAVETVGCAFDPLLHEAIMREESTEYWDGIIIQEFRKGFKLGDRLLRPAMVKVSAGPPPADDDVPHSGNEEEEADGDDTADSA